MHDKFIQEIIDMLNARGCNLKPYKPNEYQGHCPFHEDEHPSFFLNTEKKIWFCFACRPTGYDATLSALAERLGLSYTENPFLSFNTFAQFLDYLHAQLYHQQTLVEYLRTYRQLSDYVIEKAKLGFWVKDDIPYLVIPVFDDEGNPVNAKLRTLTQVNGKIIFASDAPHKYRWMTNMHPLVPAEVERPSLYPSPKIFPWDEEECVWIAGGELDALALWSINIPAVAPTKGETSLRPSDLERLPRWVVVALDNEMEVVRKSESYIGTLLRQRKDRVVTRLLWSDKDVSEVLRNQNSLWKNIIFAETHTNNGKVENGIIPTPDGTYYAFRLERDSEEKNYSVLKMTLNEWMPEVVVEVQGEEEPVIVARQRNKDKSRRRVVVSSGNLLHTAVLKGLPPLSPDLIGKPKLAGILGLFTRDIYTLFTQKSTIFTRIGLYLSEEYGLENHPLREWSAKKTCFVFSDAVLPKDVGEFCDIYQQNIFGGVTLNEQTDKEALKPFVEKLLNVYPDDCLYGVIAWFHAAMLSTFVRYVNNNRFPVLFVAGIAGTGKTSIVVELIQNIFAPTAHLPSRQTASTMRKYTNMASLPLVLDEFTPERWGEDIRDAKLFIHSCYEMLFQQVSRSARQLELPYYSYTPLCCIGESANFITKDAALTDRVFLVTFKRKAEKLDEVYIKTFQELVGATAMQRAYRRALIEFLLENEGSWIEWWNEARKIINEQVGADFSARQKNNFQVIVFGWKIFENFAKHLSVTVPEAEDIAHYFFVKGISIPIHDTVARIISLWNDERESMLEEGEDWGLFTKGKYEGCLWVRLKSFLDKLRVKYRDDKFLQQKPHEVIASLVTAKNQGHPALVEVSVVVKTKTGKPIRASVFDLSAAQKDILPLPLDIAIQLEMDTEEGGDGDEDLQYPF